MDQPVCATQRIVLASPNRPNFFPDAIKEIYASHSKTVLCSTLSDPRSYIYHPPARPCRDRQNTSDRVGRPNPASAGGSEREREAARRSGPTDKRQRTGARPGAGFGTG